MDLYTAARYSRYPEMQGHAERLHQAGHTVKARWILGDHELRSGGHSDADVWAARWAQEDLEDLVNADAVVSFTEGPGDIPGRARGGRHVEFGAALALRKPLFVVGYRENVFHHLPQVIFIPLTPDPIGRLIVEIVNFEIRKLRMLDAPLEDQRMDDRREHPWARVGHE